MRLTLFGKIFVASLLMLVFGVLFMKFTGGEETGPDRTQPASLGDYRFPLSERQAASFEREADPLTNLCSIFSDFVDNYGRRMRLRALIPGNARQSPYYFRDTQRNIEFLPAYFVAPNARGLSDALAYAEQSTDNLPECAQSTGGLILLGFPEGTRPSSSLIELNGALWWDSLALNPAQLESAAGAETNAAPVILVGSHKTLSPSQAAEPSYQDRILNLAFGNGPAIIRVSRMEFTDNQTRVWVELANKGSETLEPWAGVSTATLREEGGPALTAGQVTTEDGGLDANPALEDPTITDLLPEEPLRPKGAGLLKGYLVFPRTNPDKTLYLSLPDFKESLDDTLPIVVRIPAVK